MTFLARLRSWISAAFRRRDLDRRMDLEMQTHLALHEDELVRRGLPAGEAHRHARADFGSLEAQKEHGREAFGLRRLDELRADVRYALRLLRRSPGFALVALLSLALGIGANTAIFSLIDLVMMRTLPIRDPGGLVFIDTSGGRSGGSNGPPYPFYELIRDTNQSLSGVAAFSEDFLKVTIDGVEERLRGQHTSGSYFDLLGIRAAHGRLLTPADDTHFDRGGSEGAVAVISYNLWKHRFGLDPGVVGRIIQVSRRPVTIVGVTPPEYLGLQAGSPIDLTLPMMLAGSFVQSKGTWWMSTLGRVRAGATAEQARAELDTLFGGYLKDIGMERGNWAIALVPAGRGLDGLRRQFSEPLLILMGIVVLVLLIGCANVANLLLARAGARHPEMAVRLAIGAGRGRLIRQLLTEGAVLVTLGTIVGLGLAHLGVSFLVNLLGAGGTGILLEPRFDLRLLAFTAAVAAVTVVLFSLAPALHATKVVAARRTGSNLSLARPRVRLSHALVVLQITLAIALLCGAALFLRTLHQLQTIDAGFRRDGLLTMQVEASMPAAPATVTADERRITIARIGALWTDLAARVATLPGVTSASVGTLSPLTGRDRGVRIAIAGTSLSAEQSSTHLNQVSAGYFEGLGVELVSGRLFATSDRAGAVRVGIVNETAARTWFQDGSPLGRKISFPGQRVEDAHEIVGIVRDVRYASLRRPDQRMAYIPIEQAIDPIGSLMVHARTETAPAVLVPLIRAAARDVVPNGFVTRIGLLDERVDSSLFRERLLSMLTTVFGALALVLACIGLYGVIAFAVIRRTREIGIRIAIGARPAGVIWLMLRQTLGLVAAGVVFGTALAIVAGRFVSAQLFGVTPGDPLAIGAAVSLLLLVTLAATYVPARRASRIDPVVALRCD